MYVFILAPIWCSCRLALTIVGFLGFINLYALRVDMSFAIVCMSKSERACNQTTIANQTILTKSAECLKVIYNDTDILCKRIYFK